MTCRLLHYVFALLLPFPNTFTIDLLSLLFFHSLFREHERFVFGGFEVSDHETVVHVKVDSGQEVTDNEGNQDILHKSGHIVLVWELFCFFNRIL